MPLAPPERVREPPQSPKDTANVVLSQESPPIMARTRPRAFRRLGRTALWGAVLAILVETIAIVLGNRGHFLLATGLAWGSIVLSGLAVLSGLVAVAQRKRRALALLAVVLGVVGNPLVLVWVLAALGD